MGLGGMQWGSSSLQIAVRDLESKICSTEMEGTDVLTLKLERIHWMKACASQQLPTEQVAA
jgi:hypothetical protein